MPKNPTRPPDSPSITIKESVSEKGNKPASPKPKKSKTK